MSDVVVTVKKNAREEIRIGLDEYEGRPIFSARVWFEAGAGDWRPGKSGIAFKIELLPDFAEGVSQALEAAQARGLVK